MIEAHGLRRTFGSVVAVDDVSFVARDGEVTGLLGPNGAGKTTTLRMLYTLIAPDRGTVHVDGENARANLEATRRRLGVLPDACAIYPRLTARENVRYFGELQGLGGADLEARIDQLVEALDMGDIDGRRCAGFSSGQRRKVALARALVHGPKNVLLDEPTNGLDIMTTRAIRDLVLQLKSEGRCVVFSSHVMQEVTALCDRIVIIADGRVIAEGTAEELRRRSKTEALEDAFVALVGAEPSSRRILG